MSTPLGQLWPRTGTVPTAIGAPLGAPTGNDFSVSVTPSSQNLTQGSTATWTVNTALTSGSAQTITLAASGLPTGVSAGFSPTSVSSGGSSTMTLTATGSATLGAATVTVTGTATSGSHTATTTATVVAPTANDFSIAVSPSSQSVAQGAATTYTVTLAVTSGSAQSVTLSASGLPSGVTAGFSPTSVTGAGTSTMTLTAAAGAAVGGPVTVTVTGTAASGAHNATTTVTVTSSGGTTPAVIQAVSSGTAVPGSPHITTAPSNFTVGNWLVVAVTATDNAGGNVVTSPAVAGTWTKEEQSITFGTAQLWYAKVDTAGQNTVQITDPGGGNYPSGNILEVSNLNNTTPVLAHTNAALSSSATINYPSLTATAVNQLYVATVYNSNGVPQTNTATGGTAIMGNILSSASYNTTVYQLSAGAGAITPSIPAGSSGAGDMVAAIFTH